MDELLGIGRARLRDVLDLLDLELSISGHEEEFECALVGSLDENGNADGELLRVLILLVDEVFAISRCDAVLGCDLEVGVACLAGINGALGVGLVSDISIILNTLFIL